MNKRKLVIEVEQLLGSLAGDIAFEEKRPDPLMEFGYARMKRAIAAARLPLVELGMYEKIVAGIDRTEILRKSAEYHVASELLFDLFQELMLKSGTSERYGRLYGKQAQGGEARMPGSGGLIEGYDPPGQDMYKGHFSAMAPDQDKAIMSTLMTGLAVLRAEMMIAWAGTGLDVRGKIDDLRRYAAQAQRPLEALGLYRFALDVLASAESFADEGEPMAADELLDELERHLKARLGSAQLQHRHQ